MAYSTPLEFIFPKTIGLLGCEARIDNIKRIDLENPQIVKVSTNYSNKIFAELWVTITLGTILRAAPRSHAIVWGLSDNHDFDARNFVARLPGLASAFLADKLLRDQNRSELTVSGVRRWIEQEKNGYISDLKGTDRSIVEFDSKRASILQDLTVKGDDIDEKAFYNLFLQIRSELEVWAVGDHKRREVNKSAMNDISEFLKELFENAYKHGRLGENLIQRMIPQLRFLRVRKIVESSRSRLLDRAANTIPLIREHIEAVMEGKKENVLIEVCVSDFGQGILDHFLASSTGKRISGRPRQTILERLLYENMTSESHDAQAGLGLPNALDAASRLRAFVSLRTAEFWYARSFADRTSDHVLAPVVEGPRGEVAGTHWQFLWAPPD